MSNIFDKAVAFALKAHEGQTRKDGGVYILHPLEDATIVGTRLSPLNSIKASKVNLPR